MEAASPTTRALIMPLALLVLRAATPANRSPALAVTVLPMALYNKKNSHAVHRVPQGAKGALMDLTGTDPAGGAQGSPVKPGTQTWAVVIHDRRAARRLAVAGVIEAPAGTTPVCGRPCGRQGDMQRRIDDTAAAIVRVGVGHT